MTTKKNKKFDFNKLNDFVKRKNFMIGICVFGLTMLSIGVSYASFFTVKTNKNNQSITTGTLSVNYVNEVNAIQKNNMSTMSDELGMAQSEFISVYLQNTGSLDSNFTLNIGYDMENFNASSGAAEGVLTPLDYVMVAVWEYNSATNVDTLVAGPISVAELPIYRNSNSDYKYNRYSILFDKVGSTSSGNATKTYKIRIWLSDKAMPVVSYSYFYINTEIVAEVSNAKMQYNLSGTLKDTADAAVSNATISFHNGSLKTTTSSSGEFTLNGIYPGVYNVDITNNNETYSGNITILEGDSASVSSLGSTFSDSNIFAAANSYGTTISKILKKNNINSFSSDTILSSGVTYNLPSSYKIVGTYNQEVSGLVLKLDNANGFSLSK